MDRLTTAAATDLDSALLNCWQRLKQQPVDENKREFLSTLNNPAFLQRILAITAAGKDGQASVLDDYLMCTLGLDREMLKQNPTMNAMYIVLRSKLVNIAADHTFEQIRSSITMPTSSMSLDDTLRSCHAELMHDPTTQDCLQALANPKFQSEINALFLNPDFFRALLLDKLKLSQESLSNPRVKASYLAIERKLIEVFTYDEYSRIRPWYVAGTLPRAVS